jgi:hypothetical protein
LIRVGKSIPQKQSVMKKMIYFSLMVFLLTTGCAKVTNDPVAKPDGNEVKSAAVNGSVSWNLSTGYYIPLECDGVQVGSVFGWPIDWHVIDHYKNGELDWSIYNVTGTLTNRNTGEVFKIQESDKLLWSQGDYTFHANLMGNLGTHYILSGHFDPITFEVLVEKAVCPNGPQN